MAEPELWTRCPKADKHGLDSVLNFYCDCHGWGHDGLVRVPFDKAVERVLPFVTVYHDRPHITDADELMLQRGAAEAIVRAALGEGT